MKISKTKIKRFAPALLSLVMIGTVYTVGYFTFLRDKADVVSLNLINTKATITFKDSDGNAYSNSSNTASVAKIDLFNLSNTLQGKTNIPSGTKGKLAVVDPSSGSELGQVEFQYQENSGKPDWTEIPGIDLFKNYDLTLTIPNYLTKRVLNVDLVRSVAVDGGMFLAGDINNDGFIDWFDYALWQRSYGIRAAGNINDYNGDGIVDYVDFAVAYGSSNWNKNITNQAISSPVVVPVNLELYSDKMSYKPGEEVLVLLQTGAGNSTLSAVEANLSYDQTKYEFSSFEQTTDYDATMLAEVNNGIVRIIRGKLGGAGGDKALLYLRFKAKTTGEGTINIASANAVYSDGSKLSITPDSMTLPIADTPAPTISSTSSKTKTFSQSVPVSSKESAVTFDKTTAEANGVDKICMSVTVKNSSGAIIKNIKPDITIMGGADVAGNELSGDSWAVCLTSASAGTKRLIVSASGIVIKDTQIEFGSLRVGEGETTPLLTLSDLIASISGTVTTERRFAILDRNSITSWDKLEISGTAESDTSLKVYVFSNQISKEVSVNSDGKWSLKLNQVLDPGSHRVEAAALDKYGNESKSKVIAVFDVKKYRPYDAFIMIAFIILGIWILVETARFLHHKIRSRRDSGSTFEQVLPPSRNSLK